MRANNQRMVSPDQLMRHANGCKEQPKIFAICVTFRKSSSQKMSSVSCGIQNLISFLLIGIELKEIWDELHIREKVTKALDNLIG